MPNAEEPPDYGDEVYKILDDVIRDEINTINLPAPHGLGLPEDKAEGLADFLVDRIASTFDLRWKPRWVPAGTPHAWPEADGWHVRCTECLLISPRYPTREAALSWHGGHERAVHSE